MKSREEEQTELEEDKLGKWDRIETREVQSCRNKNGFVEKQSKFHIYIHIYLPLPSQNTHTHAHAHARTHTHAHAHARTHTQGP